MVASMDEHAQGSLKKMMKDCEDLRDKAKALEVQSTINHDNLVISLAPFLLSLSSEEEHPTTNAPAILKEKLI